MITILVLILSTNLNAQQKNSTSEQEIDDIMKWHVLRQRVERAVDRGKLNRIEADNQYSIFLSSSPFGTPSASLEIETSGDLQLKLLNFIFCQIL